MMYFINSHAVQNVKLINYEILTHKFSSSCIYRGPWTVDI